MSKHPVIHPILIVVLLALLLGIILGFVNEQTKHQIAINYNYEKQKSVLYTFNIDTEDLSKEAVFTIFNEQLNEHRLQGIHYYTHHINNEIIGYAFPFSAKGLWGGISGYLALNHDATELLGLVFVDHEETPGLGGRIDELWFKEQFRGLDITGEEDFIQFNSDGLSSISGATMTVDSIAVILNNNIQVMKKIIKEDLYE